LTGGQKEKARYINYRGTGEAEGVWEKKKGKLSAVPVKTDAEDCPSAKGLQRECSAKEGLEKKKTGSGVEEGKSS